MPSAVAQVYRRGGELIRRLPLLIALPVVAEAVQHVAEVQLGMYAGGMSAEGARLRLAFGAMKVLTIFVTILIAWRWWQFERYLARAIRPTPMMFKGVGLFLLVQLAGEGAALYAGRGFVALDPGASPPVKIALAVLPLLSWLFLSGALFPWYVGMATEDRAMTLRRSIRVSRDRLLPIWGVFMAGILPLMIVHYGIGYAALRQVGPIWGLMLVDALIVGALSAMIAATYFTLYARAAARLDADDAARPGS